MNTRRILLATDVPFWQRSTGAEQRIYSLCRYLKNEASVCGVFYLGSISVDDRNLIQQYDLDVFENTSEQPPEKLLSRFRWYADATLHQARTWLARNTKLNRPEDGPVSLTLDDYRWPWALTRFSETVEAFQPDAIVFEYITMAYLMDAMSSSQRESIQCLVDTHDMLHKRAEQFFANGFPHWLQINRSEEAEALQKFDAIMAIQDKEAAEFRKLVGDQVKTITVGHAVDRDDEEIFETRPTQPVPEKITVGYIGSKNFSNWQAIKDFLHCAWPVVMMKNQPTCELVIAGGICDWFDKDDSGHIRLGSSTGNRSDIATATQTALENVRLAGRLELVEDFYSQIDLVINPVEFGTGLKIKNAESLRFGKLLITTLNGFNGMPEATRLACMVVESVNEMGLAINAICSDLSQIRPMQQLALQLAQTEFSDSQAYSELKQYLTS